MGRRFVKPLRYFLAGKPRELRMERMVGNDECLLPVQDWRVQGGRVVTLAYAERLEVDRHGRRERWMGVGLEVGIGQVRDLGLARVEVDGVRTVHASDVAARAALVEAKQRR